MSASALQWYERAMEQKVILLDRDGIINHDSRAYIKSIDEFIFLPGSLKALARLKQAGFRIGIATNQSGIARGYYDAARLAAIHAHMLAAIRAEGGDIEAILHCPHLPDTGCPCRKPAPGMLQSLAKTMAITLEGVPFAGDKITDIMAAEAAGCCPIFITTAAHETAHFKTGNFTHVPAFSSLSDFTDALLLHGSA